MGKALYRKHRPKKLSEVIGQPHVTETLERALKRGNISHAYLLTGPKGVGKTSIARILAYEVNGLPYDEEASHLDIIEIDAASNRRIDEIRELKERINIAPTSAKYKVYIIDEVHMLTKEAFNALLKTLEEPPEHAIFILATTEAHKVPETISSRTQRFSLKPIETPQIAGHLTEIAKSEEINITPEALSLIAEHGEGSFRDSLSLLDQLRNNSSEIDYESVAAAVGKAPKDLLEDLLGAIESHDITTAAESLEKLRIHGAQAAQLAGQLTGLLRQNLLTGSLVLPLKDSLDLMEKLLDVPGSQDQSLALELALYNACLEGATDDEPLKIKPAIEEESPKSEKEPKTKETQPRKIEGIMELNQETWTSVLNLLKSKHNTLYGIARMATPAFEDGKLTLRFAFAFHQKKLSDAANQQLLKDIIHKTTGHAVVVECVLEKPDGPKIQPKVLSEPKVNLETISNIFGGAEIVE